MNKKEEKLVIPALRFPEFQAAGEWVFKKLGSFSSVSTEKIGDNICIPMSITSGVGLVSQEEKFGRIIAGESYKNYLLLKQNDFAYNKSSTKEYPEGYLSLYAGRDFAAVPKSIFTCFRINDKTHAPKYLNYLFQGNIHGRWLRKFIQVGARANGALSINDGDLLAVPIPLPRGETSLAEQQKIADCLSSLDELIAAQARKVDALKTHKKGLMQHLFPAESETQPYLRFLEYRDTDEWLIESLNELGEIITGKTPSTTDSDLWGGDILFVTPTDISEKEKYQRRTMRTVVETRSTKVLPEGSIVYTCIASIGKMALTTKPSITNQQINAVLPNNKTAGEFIYYALLQLTPRIKTIPASSTLPIINKTEFSKIVIKYPADKVEQKRIADCLSSLDDLIIAQIQKLETFRTHKQGLMQQLFPSAETFEA